ncbi:hypothetical protein D3C80_1549600 [compost metagenome]
MHSAFEDAFDEIDILGFPASLSYFDLLKTKYRGGVFTKDLMFHVGETVKMLGSYVTNKPVKTVKGEKMYFGTFFDMNGDFFDTTHFPNTTPEMPFRGDGCYLILGKVVEEFGFPSIEVIRFAKLPIIADPRFT